jgi:hypothetical protein
VFAGALFKSDPGLFSDAYQRFHRNGFFGMRDSNLAGLGGVLELVVVSDAGNLVPPVGF